MTKQSKIKTSSFVSRSRIWLLVKMKNIRDVFGVLKQTMLMNVNNFHKQVLS